MKPGELCKVSAVATNYVNDVIESHESNGKLNIGDVVIVLEKPSISSSDSKSFAKTAENKKAKYSRCVSKHGLGFIFEGALEKVT